jgi:tol-pal system protein YbgF
MGTSTAKSTAPATAGAKPQAAAPKAVVPAVAMTQAAPAPINDPDLTPPKNPKTLTANRAAKSLYERGFALYANRQYDQAILVYQNFLSRYPEDVYSDNAQFWIGESYLHMDKVAEAEAAYRKVLREYEHKNSLDGYKTPEAIYRLGTLAQKRSDQRAARYYFANVAQRFPESSAGRKAQRELDGKPTTAQSDMAEEKSGG